MRHYTLDQFADAIGVNRHSIRNWTKARVLPPPKRDGHQGVYDDDHRVRGLAIKRLRETGMTLAVIGARLAKASPSEMADLAGIAPARAPEAAPARAPAPAPAPAPSPARAPATAPAPAPTPYRSDVAVARELWERVALCPGVVLSVRADADTEARRVASEIIGAYATRPFA